MLKQYKKTLILTSLLTLLPILVGLLLWNQLPEKFATHWGISGQADSWMEAPAAIFLPPVLLLAVQWFCAWFTAKDPGNRDRNKKPFTMVLWIIPIVSNLSSYMMYALAMGVKFSPTAWMLAGLGLMFAAIGNYMPKMKMNSTMGIKVPWAYTSEENWNATHRFGGKCWMIGGLIMALSALLPGEFGIWVMIAATFALAIIPIAYSYVYYRKQKARGDTLIPFPKANTRLTKASAVVLVCVLIFVGVVLFAGELEYDFGEKHLTIKADFYSDYIVNYENIDTMEYRDGNIEGMRVGGYGSFRLLMGYFQNEEFGTYTRYTYYKPEACVVLTVNGKALVLSGETKAETHAIYQELLSRTDGK